MRFNAADKAVVVALVGLTVATLWLKDWVDAATPPAAPGEIEQAIATRLAAQGFAVLERRLPLGTLVVEGRRGRCAVLARDATEALGAEVALAQTAREIGPVRYLFGSRTYTATPILPMRIARLRREAARLIGIAPAAAVPVALAASPACGPGSFGLADLSLPA